jgi:hypothetical protein
VNRPLAWYSAAPSGQHVEGAPAAAVRPIWWDPASRAAAAELDQLEPGWMVWYGPWSRRFYAIAAWNAPCPVLLDAPTAEELRDQMRQAEDPAMFALHRWTGAA